LDNKGKVWAWGNNQQNQLGRRVHERRHNQALIPREVEIPGKPKVKSIHSGSFHSFAITTHGHVYSWGLNCFAQCGFYVEPKDDSTISLVPVPTRAPALQDQDIVTIDGGDRHSIALTSDGSLLTWGSMTAHQVGVGRPRVGKTPVPSQNVILDKSGRPRCLIAPYKISLYGEEPCTSIASGSNHNIAIGSGGLAYSWGVGDQHQCGNWENPGMDIDEPDTIVTVLTLKLQMVAAACGGSVTVLAGTVIRPPIRTY
jgi:regulator of chromosome condensation